VLAVFGRAFPRDFADLEALSHHFELESMMDLAAQKDTGFDRERFLEALSSISRFTADDFALSQYEYEQLKATVDVWRSQLRRELRKEPHGRNLGVEL
jgi:hypothetical protein